MKHRLTSSLDKYISWLLSKIILYQELYSDIHMLRVWIFSEKKILKIPDTNPVILRYTFLIFYFLR